MATKRFKSTHTTRRSLNPLLESSTLDNNPLKVKFSQYVAMIKQRILNYLDKRARGIHASVYQVRQQPSQNTIFKSTSPSKQERQTYSEAQN